MKCFFYRKYLAISISLFCILMLGFESCKTNNSVVSCFGQRKYTKGYYSFLHSKPKESILETQVAIVSKISYEDQAGKAKCSPGKVNYGMTNNFGNDKSGVYINSIKSLNSYCKIGNSATPIYHELTKIMSHDINKDNTPDHNNQQAKPYNTGKAVLGVILIILGLIGVLFSIFLIEFAVGFGAAVGSNEIVPLILSIAILIIGIVTVAKA
jgi:hypothetical protein